jgi:uncharacterized protein
MPARTAVATPCRQLRPKAAPERRWLLAASTCVLLSSAGCASKGSTSGAFKSYKDSFARADAAAQAQSLEGAEAVFATDAARSDGAGLLANLELGAFYQAFGEFERSRQCFDRVDQIAREIEQRAVVSGRAVGRNLGALLTNDNAIEYRSEAFEKVMARSLNAINYLMAGDVVAARIEIRKASEYQDLERRRHDEELQKRRDQAAAGDREWALGEQGLSSSSEFTSTVAQMNEYARAFETSFQNPFTYLLSGLVYEMNGELDDAMLDYRRAYELWPESRPAAALLASTAAARSRTDELASLTSAIDPEILEATASSRVPEHGRVLLIYASGRIPQKQEVKFPIPVPGVKEIAWVAFATYTDYRPSPDQLEVRVGSTSRVTEPIVDLRALAVRALQEKWKATAARQVGRVVAKAVAKQELRKEMTRSAGPLAGAIAGLAGAVYQIASERADLRGWYSLPDRIQVATIDLAAGAHRIEIERAGTSSGREAIDVVVHPGRTSLVFARGFGNVFGTWSPPGEGATVMASSK